MKTLTSRRIIGLVSVLMVLAAVSGTGYAAEGVADPLSLVPPRAFVAVVIKDLHKSSAQISSYIAQLDKLIGPGAIPPVNVETLLMEELGLGGALALDKPVVLVIMNPQLFPGAAPVAILCQPTTFKALAELMEAKPVPGSDVGVLKGTTEDFTDVYIAKVNKSGYVVMAATESLVKVVLSTEKGLAGAMNAQAKALLANSDAYAFINIQALSPVLKPYLGMASMFMGAAGMGGMPGMPGMAAPTTGPTTAASPQQQMQQMAGNMIQVAGDLLDQLDSVSVGLSLDPKYVKLATAVSFKAGSSIATDLASHKPTNKSLFTGLPGGDFFVALGMKCGGELPSWYESMLDMQASSYPNPADAKKVKELARQAFAVTEQISFRIAMTPITIGKLPLSVQQVVITSNAKKYMELSQQSCELSSKMSIPTATGKPMTLDMQYQKAVANVAGVSIDQISIDLLGLIQSAGVSGQEAMQAQTILAMFFPDGKLTIRIAAVNDKVVIIDIGSDDAGLEKLIKTAQSPAAPLAKNAKIVELGKVTLKNTFFEYYIDPGQVLNSLGSLMPLIMMASGGAGMQGAMPTFPTIDTPPIAIIGALDGSTVQCELVVPFDTVTRVADWAMTVKKSMTPPRKTQPTGPVATPEGSATP